MERTLSANYPLLRQNKGVLLNMLPKYGVRIKKVSFDLKYFFFWGIFVDESSLIKCQVQI